jgi:hypothetical protein
VKNTLKAELVVMAEAVLGRSVDQKVMRGAWGRLTRDYDTQVIGSVEGLVAGYGKEHTAKVLAVKVTGAEEGGRSENQRVFSGQRERNSDDSMSYGWTSRTTKNL